MSNLVGIITLTSVLSEGRSEEPHQYPCSHYLLQTLIRSNFVCSGWRISLYLSVRRFKHLYKDFSNFVLLCNLGMIRSSRNQHDGGACTDSVLPEASVGILYSSPGVFCGLKEIHVFFLPITCLFSLFKKKLICKAVVVSVLCSSNSCCNWWNMSALVICIYRIHFCSSMFLLVKFSSRKIVCIIKENFLHKVDGL